MIDSHQQPRDPSSRLRLWYLVALFVLLQLPLLLQPIGRTHKWRQADTAAVARSFTLESANIFYPRVDVRRDLSGVTGMEFPLYQYIVGLTYRFVSIYQDWPAKLVALLASFGILWYGSQFLVELFNIRHDVAIAAFTCNPVLFFYSTRVMPETTGLFLVLFGTLYYVRATQESKSIWTNILLAFLGLGTGALVVSAELL